MKQPCVYIMTTKSRGTLYVGVTSNLAARVWHHANHLVEGFTKRYDITRLVWFEVHPTMESAIRREKAIKEWKRVWKIELVEKANSEWKDLRGSL